MKNKKPNLMLLGGLTVAAAIAAAVFLSFSKDGDVETKVTSAELSDSGSGTSASDRIPGVGSNVPERSGLTEKLESILEEGDLREMPGYLYDLMDGVTLAEVRELLALSDDAQNYSAALRDEMKVAAFEQWYRLDPAAAIRELDASTLSPSRKASRIEVYLEDWAKEAPQAVMAFLEREALTGVSPDLAYSAVARAAASRGNRDLIEEALSQVSEPKRRESTVKSVARTLQRDHAPLYDAWVSALPAEERSTALAEGAWMLVDKDIGLALDRLSQLEQIDAEKFPVTRSRVVVKWTREDPPSAGDWVLAQALPNQEREDLFALFFRVWFSEDRERAVEWAENSIEHGKFDDAFMNRVVSK